jgi:D-sedoheptulose 7-phosphate isomerase
MIKEMISSELGAHKETIEKVIEQLQPEIEKACSLCVSTIKNGNKILFFGNGGSAADAQHLAAELSGRFKKERKGLPGIALTTDTSAITAIGNDYEYDYIFERQVEALAGKGDLLIGISSTGNSENVIRAFSMGRTIGCKTLGLSGKGGGKMNGNCDLNIVVPAFVTARVQEMHILIGHILCQAIDDQF